MSSEIFDPDVRASPQSWKEFNTEPAFETTDLKMALVIEPTHPSNSGSYYCATADDVAHLIVKNQGDFCVFCDG